MDKKRWDLEAISCQISKMKLNYGINSNFKVIMPYKGIGGKQK